MQNPTGLNNIVLGSKRKMGEQVEGQKTWDLTQVKCINLPALQMYKQKAPSQTKTWLNCATLYEPRTTPKSTPS